MSDLLAARSQMGMSLAFHIIFAVIGMAMPVLMVLAEWRWRKSGDAAYLELAKRWAKGTAIFFAVGGVSGTVLSFELGLLWPRFMAWAGAIIGMPFSLEGFAFFLEAIFLGIYLYGWKRVTPGVHLFAGIVVALSGAASGIFVTMANAWMNTPVGFAIANGRVVEVEPLAAMLNPSAFSECLHMTVAAYAATGLAVAGIHALMLLRRRNQPFHSRALEIALTVGGIASILQPFTGDVIARAVARNQPLKLAALEGHYETRAAAPLQVVGSLEIPAGLSLLAFHSRDAVVKGLKDFPRDQWPAVHFLRPAFLIMVTAGFLAAAVACWAGIQLWWRHQPPTASRWLLWAVVCAAPLGFIAIEAGWTVTELGRQPWIIYGFMRTADAVTPMPGLAVPFVGFTLLYLLLAILVAWMLLRHIADAPREAGEEADAVLR